jgi:hypothetical protein
MYWKKQEQWVFDLVLFIVVGIQVVTVLRFTLDPMDLHHGLTLAGVNVLVFAAMIPYVRWTWSAPSYRRALLRVVTHELAILSLVAAGTLLALLVGHARGRT